jgi:hypothetical protein
VTSHQVDLQVRETLRRYGHLGKLAEAGGHAVHDVTITNYAVDVVMCSQHSLASIARQRNGATTSRHGLDVGDGE